MADPAGIILFDVELVALRTQQALRSARNRLHPRACEVLSPFDGLVSTPSPCLQAAIHVATYAARLLCS